jgi:hypothetical protein
MKQGASVSSPAPAGNAGGFVWAVLVLLAVLALLFAQSFQPAQILFFNDGPLGAQVAKQAALPDGFRGIWQDLNWVGGNAGNALANITYLLLYLLKPLAFAKFYVPLTLLILGLSAWLFFRQLGFGPVVCILGSLGAAFNSDCFSYSCWGLGAHTLAIASVFLALAALVTLRTNCVWLRAILAGMAVGLSIMEGFDSGAILSLYVAAFVMFQAWTEAGPPAQRVVRGLGRVGLVAGFAAFFAAQALTVLIGTSIKGVVGMEQDAQSKAERWDYATIWSLPKVESLRVVVPGLFGYRMDTPGGGNYWGSVGQTPGVITSRWSGAGVYGGVLVVLVAAWAGLQSLRGKNSLFSAAERKHVWFWLAALIVSLLLAFGRHAPFYQFFYALPYFSTIRNPIKFMHPFGIALVVLFGFGLQALWRSCVARGPDKPLSFLAQIKTWWALLSGFDRRWAQGSVLVLTMAVFGWVRYLASRKSLEEHLDRVGFPGQLGAAIAGFSIGEVGWFVFFLTLAIAAVTLVLSGSLSGRRAKWAGLIFGGLLFADFAHANRPWIVHWNYVDKYGANAVIDVLRRNSYEQRVKLEPPIFLQNQFASLQQLYGAKQLQSLVDYYLAFKNLYDIEWVQHLFQFYNIQCLDVIQEPRVAAENAAFRAAFPQTNSAAQLRLLQLTNTRFLLGIAGESVNLLNQQLDPVQRRFRLHTAFALTPKGTNATRSTDFTVVPVPNGPLALIEFTGALPRARLYANWQVSTNDPAALKRLADPAFDPWQTVLVANELPAPTPAPSTNQAGGTVEFKSYAPRRIKLEADTKSTCVLLLNDKFDPNWKLLVDGRPATLLRCNFLMQGVQLEPGKHLIEFRFQPPTTSLYISLAAIAIALGLCAWVAWPTSGKASAVSAVSAEPNAALHRPAASGQRKS